MSDINLYLGDCLYRMAEMAENSIDTIITDPPYGLSFMGKDWDHGVPGVPFWTEALRVAKPGAMLLAFGGTRTFHRLACTIEDAGWEIRDCLMWLYGSGFPKSHDISKALDRMAGAEREVIGSKVGLPGYRNGDTGPQVNAYGNGLSNGEAKSTITAPATESAKLWEGWGTALKPAWEPIILAMKPLDGTFADNALKWNVAGLAIDAGRVGNETIKQHGYPGEDLMGAMKGNGVNGKPDYHTTQGRWPANLILDEESARLLDEMSGERKSSPYPYGTNSKGGILNNTGEHRPGSGYSDTGGASRFFYCAKASRTERNAGLEGMPESRRSVAYGSMRVRECNVCGTRAKEVGPNGRWPNCEHDDWQWAEQLPEANKGAAQNNHPTVKPLALMRYLCRLTQTPTGGVVLDPFMGSGTTGVACVQTGRNFIGVEIDPGYFEIAQKRIEQAQELKNNEQSNN